MKNWGGIITKAKNDPYDGGGLDRLVVGGFYKGYRIDLAYNA